MQAETALYIENKKQSRASKLVYTNKLIKVL